MPILRSSPWICDAHLAYQRSYFERHHRPATTASRLPAPVQPETRAMPANNGVRFHDRQRIANAKPIEANKNQSVNGVEGLFLRSGSAQDVYLLPQRQNFRLERCPRPKQIYDHPNNESDKISHPATASPDSRSAASQIEFATGTAVEIGIDDARPRNIDHKNCFAELEEVAGFAAGLAGVGEVQGGIGGC
jgi:hypothetical protein